MRDRSSTRTDRYRGRKSFARMAMVCAIVAALLAALTSVASAETEQGWITVDELDLDVNFDGGWALQIELSGDGNRLALGQFRSDEVTEDSGRVRVYERSGGGWVQVGPTILGDAVSRDHGNFGQAMSLDHDGSHLAVGAPGDRSLGSNTGYAKVYEWSGSDWDQLGTTFIPNDTEVTLGSAVQLSENGDTFALATLHSDVGADDGGLIQVFDWSGSQWVQRGTDLVGAEDERLGGSLQLSANGERLATIAQNEYLLTTFTSTLPQIRTYEWSGSDWVSMGSPIDGEFDDVDPDDDGFAPWSITLSSDGTRLAASGQFAARVYEWTGSEWEQVGEDVQEGIWLSLDEDGSRIAVGHQYYDGDIDDQAVLVFDWTGSEWASVGTPILEAGYLQLAGDGTVVTAPYIDNRVSDPKVRTHALDLTCAGLTPTIDMNANGGVGIGTAGDDVIVGTTGPDVIDGLGGNDTICAGDGDDTVVGGDGDDTMYGEAGADVMRGNKGADVLIGGLGDDRLTGGTGDDTIEGGDGNDFLGGFGGADTINGGDGNETIFGGFGADMIDGGPGDDKIRGLVGNDTINGGSGDDTLDGDKGTDTINGGDGDDLLRGGNSDDVLNGDGGDDDVRGGKADDTLSGGDGSADICTGNGETIADTADATCETIKGVP